MSSPSLLNHGGDRPVSQLSKLESLPVELIEKIFLYSLEVNLARASPILTQHLSSESIYRAFLLYSFFDENKESRIRDQPLHPRITRAFRPAEYRTLGLKERKELQAAVLDCRWCTYARVKACLPELLKLTVQSVWRENGIRMQDEELRRLDSFNYDELDQGKATSEDIKPFAGVDVRDGLGMELYIYSTFKLDIEKEAEEEPPIPMANPTRSRMFHPIKFFGFPTKILREPWSWDKIRFFHLVRNHRETPLLFDDTVLPMEDTIKMRQTVQSAAYNAIRKSDLNLLPQLLILDKIFWEAVHYRQRRKKIRNRPNQYKISEAYFTVAVTEAPNVTQTLRLLIRFDNASLPSNNAELRSWAEQQNNSFGRTMLKLMQKFRLGDGHIGRDVAMLMLDKNFSNAQSIVAERYRAGGFNHSPALGSSADI